MKRLIRSLLIKLLGRDLVYLTADQREQLTRDSKRHFRDLLIEEVLIMSRGEVNLKEARLLAELVKNLQTPGPIVEIGTLFGSSAQVILLEKEQEREFISVDSYCWNPLNISADLHYKITQQILEEASQDHNTTLLRIDKNEFYDTYQGLAPSLVFCDANHSYEETKRDIEWAQKVGAEVICGHDYDAAKFPGVVQIVDELGGPRKRADRLWVL